MMDQARMLAAVRAAVANHPGEQAIMVSPFVAQEWGLQPSNTNQYVGVPSDRSTWKPINIEHSGVPEKEVSPCSG